MELNKVKGVGPKTEVELNKLGIFSSDDLIRYYPYRYNVYKPTDINNCNDDDTITITGTIQTPPQVFFIKRNLNRLSFKFLTSNNIVSVVIFNRAYIKQHLSIGKSITLVGKYNRTKNSFTASEIKLTPIYQTKIEPVYHTVNGIKSSTLKKCIEAGLSNEKYISEIIPEYISQNYDFINTLEAVKEMHNPTNTNKMKQARIKLKYEELFEFMFKINLIKYRNQIFDDFVIKQIDEKTKERILKIIPFKLTNDQIQAIDDVIKDFNDFKRMNRLVLGDVGSGKTMVAFVSMLLNNECGYQSALLAPTEVLARQHYENLQNLLKDTDIKIALLVGSQTKKEKEAIINDLADSKIDILIGTHAILEENVSFGNLGLVVTDEQHRFGVNQRKSLQNKGKYVDVLYMSATPIPRTYALTIYGDMDISMIKEKPSGRKDIYTKVHKFEDINNVYNEINSEINNNHQIYVVVPLIEENEEIDLNDVEKVKNELTINLSKNAKIEVLHGKMKPKEKDKIMNDYKNGDINVLISTTVIEVGVDVKNATLMVIYNAERFGLATLHQLRGRVGRNELDCKCFLITDQEKERLKVLEESNDGFYISQKDFELRGSGDLFGIRQSGDMVFKVADLRYDYKILLQCKKDTEQFVLANIENDFRNYPYYKNILQQLMNND